MQVLSQLFNPLDQLEELKSENAAVRSSWIRLQEILLSFSFFLVTKKFNILLFC